MYTGRYVAMMQATHSAIAAATSLPTMLWVSTDRMWTASPWWGLPLHPCTPYPDSITTVVVIIGIVTVMIFFVKIRVIGIAKLGVGQCT